MTNHIHNIFLAIDTSSDESKNRIPFYDDIGSVCDSLGYNCYLLHKEFTIGKVPPEKVNDIEVIRESRRLYDAVSNHMIPNSELVIAYMDIPSTDVGMMMGKAMRMRKPILRFYNSKNHEAVLESEGESLIPLNTASEKVIKEARRMRDSYVQFVLQFNNDEEALQLLKEELAKFFY